MIQKWLLLVVLLVLQVSFAVAQKTEVSGKIFDIETKEPLPFVNISFKNSKIGTTSDINGDFTLSSYYATDSLVVSFVGYLKSTKLVKLDLVQEINFGLEKSTVALKEVVIVYQKAENPAHAIVRGVIRNKHINNREKLAAYEYQAYNKIEFDVNNIDEEYKNRRVMKPFQFVFENIDTSESKPFLPIFITETTSDYYYKKNPKSEKEIIHGTKVSGVENKSVSQFMGDMYQNVNIYKNYVEVFSKSFLSPVSDFGFVSYKYYLTDSALLGNNWCYKISFIPKRKHELTFEGDMWVNDTTYAIRMVDASLSGDANINFVNEFHVRQEYEQVEPEVWMLVKDNLVVDFTVSNQTIGFYGRKNSSYRKFSINRPKEDAFYFGAENVVIEENAHEQDNAFWDEARHEKLSEKEKNIYAMVDTIQQVPAFHTYMDLIQMFITGYKVWGNVELGPYFTTYSFNQIEGHRFRVGARTSNKFSTRTMIEAYTAYGLTDEEFKYGGSIDYFISKKPRQSIGASYKKDVEQLGQGNNAWQQDNIIASVARRGQNNKLNGYEDYNIYYEREWFQGLSNRISFNHRMIWPLGALEFEFDLPDGSPTTKPRITTSEFSFYTYFAYKEKYVSGEFSRTSLGTKFPTIQGEYTLGVQNLFESEYNYHKLVINVKDRLTINPFGWMEYILEAGKVWGNLPYPLMELHSGNETYAYQMSAFNLMNYYEFVSDEFVSAAVTHHFNGLVLNKIPLIRKLDWREVASAKAVMGRFNDANRYLMNFPTTLHTLNKPYVEGGVGIENVFKVLRFDVIWRLSHLQNENIAKFGFRGMFQFSF